MTPDMHISGTTDDGQRVWTMNAPLKPMEPDPEPYSLLERYSIILGDNETPTEEQRAEAWSRAQEMTR